MNASTSESRFAFVCWWKLPLLCCLLLLGGCNGGSTTSPPPGVRTVETLLSNAAFPAALRFAPDAGLPLRLFFLELKTGKVRIVRDGQLQAQPFATLPVATGGEQGLLGIAFDPNFAANRFVYLYHTHPNPPRNRVVRFTDNNGVGTNETVIVDNLPTASNHVGGRLGFGPDGLLYVTLGDVTVPANSQTQSTPAGKLLRYNRDGSIPAANPFANSPVFALGLRNPFGLAFHPLAGTPYVSDNGQQCDDEVNRTVRGGNYGWRPEYSCGENDPRFIAPIARFNPSVAPTGMTFYRGNVFPEFRNNLLLTSFNDGAVRRFLVDESRNGRVLEQETIVNGNFGNLLDITTGPDGNLYFSSTTAIMQIVRR